MQQQQQQQQLQPHPVHSNILAQIRALTPQASPMSNVFYAMWQTRVLNTRMLGPRS
jgi:hypothetical protein